MQKSFVERIFPKPRGPILPQYDDEYLSRTSASRNPERKLGSNSSSSSRSLSRVSSIAESKGLTAAPLSASTIHHDDPFLGIERASKALQATLQSLLDFQSQSLSGRQAANQDDNLSQSSVTPTPSTSNVVPVRQPKKRKLTLAGARRGIKKSLQEFARLKEEEITITESQSSLRADALQKAQHLQDKRDAVELEMQQLEDRRHTDGAEALRHEASLVEAEIRELEDKLMELKAKNRHLVSRAEQIESSHASEKSSFQGTLAMIERDTRSFLRHPPVPMPLDKRTTPERSDMYVLRPERRTLAMAKDQWSNESAELELRQKSALEEKQALRSGVILWQKVLSGVTSFEQQLREYTHDIRKAGGSSLITDDLDSSQGGRHRDLTATVVGKLNETISILEDALAESESGGWNVLICAVGAELETFYHARTLLHPDFASSTNEHEKSHTGQTNELHPVETRDSSHDSPSADLLEDQSTQTEQHAQHFGTNGHQSPSSSNESLRQTLKDLEPYKATQGPNWPPTSDRNGGKSVEALQKSSQRHHVQSESEDDEPNPDLFLSH